MAFGRKHATRLVTLLFTDMVDSTALKQRLGRQSFEFFELYRRTETGPSRMKHCSTMRRRGSRLLLILK